MFYIPLPTTIKTLLNGFFFPSHVYMDQSIRETILCMREFLKVHTINYFSSPKSEFWNCSFIDRWAAVTVIGNPRKHQMLWSTYQQVKGGALKHSAYWRKAFRGCRATVTYETSDLTPASFRTSVFSKQPNKLTIFCDYQRLPGELANSLAWILLNPLLLSEKRKAIRTLVN